ncbi:hypothetical protein B0H13DRAFT_1868296 [Mycena leptocephala]|nr:hypothetical protein B0H13DRAFT_1868296 [Mycena leptocephala]
MPLQYASDKAYSDPRSLHTESPSHSDRQGPSRLQWLVIISVCIVGGWVLANTLYTPKEVTIAVELNQDTTDALGAVLHAADEKYQGTSELAVRGLGGSELVQLDTRGLNPFATFTAGNAGSKVGLILGGVGLFNVGVSACEQGNFFSCVSGIPSGLILTAAGLWAPIPQRSLGLYYENATIAITDHDPTSDHPAHRFISGIDQGQHLHTFEPPAHSAYGRHIRGRSRYIPRMCRPLRVWPAHSVGRRVRSTTAHSAPLIEILEFIPPGELHLHFTIMLRVLDGRQGRIAIDKQDRPLLRSGQEEKSYE